MKKVEELEKKEKLEFYLTDFEKRFNRFCLKDGLVRNADRAQKKYISDKLYYIFSNARCGYESCGISKHDILIELYKSINNISFCISVLSLPKGAVDYEVDDNEWRYDLVINILNEFVYTEADFSDLGN